MTRRALIVATVAHGTLLALPVAAAAFVSGVIPPASVCAVWASLVLWGALESSWSAAASSGFETDRTAASLPLAAGATLLAVVLVALVEPTAVARSVPVGLTVPGLTAISLGGALRRAAYVELGRHYLHECALRPTHELVRTGVFAHCRHPSEVGTLLIAFGVGGATGSVAALVLAVCVLTPIVGRRIRLEERLLAARFGREYDAYRAATPALLPRLRRQIVA